MLFFNSLPYFQMLKKTIVTVSLVVTSFLSSKAQGTIKDTLKNLNDTITTTVQDINQQSINSVKDSIFPYVNPSPPGGKRDSITQSTCIKPGEKLTILEDGPEVHPDA